MKTEGMHVVRPRAAGLAVHKMEITRDGSSLRGRGRAGGGDALLQHASQAAWRRWSAWLIGHGVEAAVMEGTGVYWMAPFEALEEAGDRGDLGACAAGEAVEGAQDRRSGQCVARLHLPVRALHTLPCAASAVPGVALVEPAAPNPGRAALHRTQPCPEDRRPRRCTHRRHPERCLRPQRPDDPRRAGGGGGARSHPPPRSPTTLARKLEGLGEALSLSLGDNDRFILNDLLEEHDAIDRRIEAYTKTIDEQMTPWEEQLRLLTTIPGHRPHRRVDDPDRDRTRHRRVRLQGTLWPRGLGSAPANNESGGKRGKARTAAGAPGPCAPPSSCARTARPEPRDASSRPTTAPLPPGAATSAPSSPAHTSCCASFMSCSRPGGPYYDRTADYEALMIKRNAPRWIRMLRRYGYIAPADPELRTA